jgi:hypothetical protein
VCYTVAYGTPEAHPSLAGFPGAANWFLAHCSSPRLPASLQIPTRLIPCQKHSYGFFSRIRRCQAGGVSDHTATFTPKVNRPIERSEMRIISSPWGANKAERKCRRSVRKGKIRLDVLDLQDPALDGPTTSLEDIRRQVTPLASPGPGPGTGSRSVPMIPTAQWCPAQRYRAGSDVEVPRSNTSHRSREECAEEGIIGRLGQTTLAKTGP